MAKFPIALILIVTLCYSCKKKEPVIEQSAVGSIPVGLQASILPHTALDESGNYLYIGLRDMLNGTGILKKVNLSTLAVEKELKLNFVPIMARNMIITEKNELFSTFYNFQNQSQLIIKFDADLNILKEETVAKVPGGNHGRTRLIRSGPNRITAVFSNEDTSGGWYLHYKTMDDDLNIINQVLDTSSIYGSSLTPSDFIKTSDGGFLYSAIALNPPFYISYSVVEKRDANFKLNWRKKYSTSANINASTIRELNGKYYLWSNGEDNNYKKQLFVLVYDKNGNLAENKPIINEAILDKDLEPMVVTENNKLLMLAVTTLNTNRNLRKGIIYSADASMNNLQFNTFGGNGSVTSCQMLKISSNKYLLLYLDDSFLPDGNLSRLVIRYVDSNGDFLD